MVAGRCPRLGGGKGLYLVQLLGDDDGGVRLQVEVFLPANARLALQHVIALVAGQHRIHVAAVQPVVPVLQNGAKSQQRRMQILLE